MCGRYSLTAPGDVVAEIFGLVDVPELRPRWNIAPTQQAAVIRQGDDGRRLDLLKWGLVPFWAKDAAIGSRMINARSETVAEKPSFKHALKSRRCIVPADGFYEWQKTAEGKVPTRIQRRDGRPLGFAGLWELWTRGPGAPLETFTILTTPPNNVLRPIHDRMPVILEPEDFALWLDPKEMRRECLEPLFEARSGADLETFPVSRHVNSPANDDAECARPAG
jgi:putative SOS response-associated peptidase YedK